MKKIMTMLLAMLCLLWIGAGCASQQPVEVPPAIDLDIETPPVDPGEDEEPDKEDEEGEEDKETEETEEVEETEEEVKKAFEESLSGMSLSEAEEILGL